MSNGFQGDYQYKNQAMSVDGKYVSIKTLTQTAMACEIDRLQSENEQLSKLLERMVEDSFNLIGEHSKFNAMAYRYGRIKTYSQLYEESLAAYEAFKASKK